MTTEAIKASLAKIGTTFGPLLYEVLKMSDGELLLKLIPLPDDLHHRNLLLGMVVSTGAIIVINKWIDTTLPWKRYPALSPRQLLFKKCVMNISKKLPLYKVIYNYIHRGYEYHSLASAEEIVRIKKRHKEEFMDEHYRGRTMWHYAEFSEEFAPVKMRIASEDPSEGINDNAEGVRAMDPDEQLSSSFDNMTRALGHFTKESKVEILTRAQRTVYPAGHKLFTIGDPDDAMYFVVEGCVNVNCIQVYEDPNNPDTKFTLLKKVVKGGNINSIMSFLDCLTVKKLIGHTKNYKTIQAECMEECKIVRIPFQLFVDCFSRYNNGMPLIALIRSTLLRVFQIRYTVFDRLLNLRTQFLQEFREVKPDDLEEDWEKEYPTKNTGGIHRVSEKLRKEAIEAVRQYFYVPIEGRYLIEECEVLSVDICHGTAPITSDYLTYVHKGVVEVFYRNAVVSDERPPEVNIQISSCQEPFEDCFMNEEHMVWVFSGQMYGGKAIITGDSGFEWRRLLCKSCLVQIPMATFTKMIEKYPQVMFTLAQELLRRTSKYARQMDFCVEWVRIDSGIPLFSENDTSDDSYVVINGCLSSQRIENRRKVVDIGGYRRGDWVGLVETLTGMKRTKAVVAIRETELAKLPVSFITSIKNRYPNVARQMLKYLANRVLQKGRMTRLPPSMHKRCNTMTVVPVSAYAPACVFAVELMKCYCAETGGTAVIVSLQDICERLSKRRFDDINDVAVTEYLATLEERHDLIIFLIDNEICPWSYKCCSSSDLIMGVVTSKDQRREVREIEELYLSWAFSAKKELVICHEMLDHPGGLVPSGTKRWLKDRPWLQMHHHVRYPSAAFQYASCLDWNFVNELYSPLKAVHDKHSDVARIARWLAGKSTGIVFGTCDLDGVAAHLGALQAMEYLDVPIDLICGAGWGALVAALYSLHQCSKKVERKLLWIFCYMTDGRLRWFDSTIPYVARFSGDLINSCFYGAMGNAQVEDLIIPFFVSTCDISSRRARMHRCGDAWRLARASATKIGMNPPMCDPVDGGYLVDGSYCHPLPMNLMRKFGAGYLIAIEIIKPDKYYVLPSHDEKNDFRSVSQRYTIVPSFFKIRDVLSKIQSAFYQRKMMIKDPYNVIVQMDIRTGFDMMELDHESFYLILYRGYSVTMGVLTTESKDRIRFPTSKNTDPNVMEQIYDNTKRDDDVESLPDITDDCDKLLHEEKQRYQRNEVKEIIKNFENSNIQFLRMGQLL